MQNRLTGSGTYLYPIDKLFYTAFVGACYETIFKTLEWSNNKTELSYVLSRNPKKKYWVGNPYFGWSKFRNASLEKIRSGAKYVFFTDISGFYDNIEINTLISDLRAIGCDEVIVNNISACLRRWAQAAYRGIPQGFNASDILAKVYLNAVDQFLRDSGIDFLRYVDDYRIFCSTELEAKQAIKILTKILRKKGLSLQTGKSKILPAEAAISEIEGVIPILQKVEQDLIDEIFGIDNPYGTLFEADKILSSESEALALSSIIQSYDLYIKSPKIQTFDKTLFHFLLNRLGKAKNHHAVEHCIQVLKYRPEETEVVLKYAFDIGAYESIENDFIRLLSEEELLYPYQAYLILKTIFENEVTPSQSLLFQCRKFVKSREFPFYLRAYSKTLLGRFGSFADLELLETIYSESMDQFEQSTIICCLLRMEKTRRNSFLQRASTDGDLQKRAVEYTKRI